MNYIPATPSFARTPRLPCMRSQRIVHVVQTEDNNDVSIVTVSEDGRSQATQETVDFSAPNVANREYFTTHVHPNEVSNRVSTGDPIIFEVDLEDGDLQRLTWCDCEDHKPCARNRRASLFSDDEFEAIRLRFPERPKRTPQPLNLSSRKESSTKGRTLVPPVHANPPSSSSSHGHSLNGPALGFGNTPTQYAEARGPYDSPSSATLVSAGSASSSTTFFDRNNYPKSGGRTFCAFEKEGGGSPKPVDVITPDNVTGTRGLVDLRVYGYGFDWSRFAGRSEAAHGLRPDEAAELEVYLKKGSNAFPSQSPTKSKSSPIKLAFEKKLSDVFKLLK